MAEKFDVVALGELLIDFTENGVSNQGNGLFEACPGGAPCNVLAMLRKTGKSCAFVGKVGDDMFWQAPAGYYRGGRHQCGQSDHGRVYPHNFSFRQDLCERRSGLLLLPQTRRGYDADCEELPPEIIENAKIFHFGTLSMTHPGIRAATVKAIELAKQGSALISFDPNLRPPLWDDLEEARKQIAWGLGKCDILKIADNELLFMTGEKDFVKGAAILHAQYPNIKVLNVTAGADGSYSFYGEDEPVFVAFLSTGRHH